MEIASQPVNTQARNIQPESSEHDYPSDIENKNVTVEIDGDANKAKVCHELRDFNVASKDKEAINQVENLKQAGQF